LRGDRAPLIWLPRFDPTTVVVAQAPKIFAEASSVSRLTPAIRRGAVEGEYWLVNHIDNRLAAVLIGAARVDTPAAVVIPLDAAFVARAEAAAHLWRIATGRPGRRTANRLTQHQRRRVALMLRALDGHLAAYTYREIARVLFGAMRVPTGPAWKTHDLRDRTIRLVRTALHLMRAGYLDLLR
jgi:hypothetical protein